MSVPAAQPDVHVIDTCASRAHGPERDQAFRGDPVVQLARARVRGRVRNPSRWLWLSDRLAGGDFKFRDYESVYGVVDPIPVMLPEGFPFQR